MKKVFLFLFFVNIFIACSESIQNDSSQVDKNDSLNIVFDTAVVDTVIIIK